LGPKIAKKLIFGHFCGRTRQDTRCERTSARVFRAPATSGGGRHGQLAPRQARLDSTRSRAWFTFIEGMVPLFCRLYKISKISMMVHRHAVSVLLRRTSATGAGAGPAVVTNRNRTRSLAGQSSVDPAEVAQFAKMSDQVRRGGSADVVHESWWSLFHRHHVPHPPNLTAPFRNYIVRCHTLEL
jgi:hypothetical protein